MADKKENKNTKHAEADNEKKEKRLMEEHPYETMSQVQNRYGKGRKKNGLEETPHQDGRGSNH